MKKHYGNLVSWSSVFIVLIAVTTKVPIYIALAICIAAIMDMFDGKLARKYGDDTREARLFGELTDSLCDVINFGVMPGFILPVVIFNEQLSILHIIASLFFVWGGIYRLARFSAQKDEGVKCVDYYTGIPITVAGPLLGCISLFIHGQFIAVIITFILGYSMVSNLKIKKLVI